MIFWTLQITIISIILIFLVHHLFMFFKSTLTIPKIKDFVNSPIQKYENIYNIISKPDIQYTPIDLLPTNKDDMKTELKNFLKNQLKNESSAF